MGILLDSVVDTIIIEEGLFLEVKKLPPNLLEVRVLAGGSDD